jgi:hypothetical protein
MKKLLSKVSDWLLWLVVGVLVVGLALTFGSFQRNAESAAPGTPSTIRTLTRAPYPPPDIPPIPPRITRIFPTPAMPITTTVRMTRDSAIAKAMGQNPEFANLQARGQLTVTAKLTTYGTYSGSSDTTHSRFHPSLPVWVVEVETPPWTRWVGPVGQQIQQTYRGQAYLFDATTGDLLFGESIPADGAKK